MSWIYKLYETYENCSSEIGKDKGDNKIPLLPIAHSTQNAQIEVTIDEDGKFLRASLVAKDEATTIIPVTEDSASRSSGITPHPLCDKLIYVAGDYTQYVENKKGEDYYKDYIKKLEAWCNSSHCNKNVDIIFKYLKNKSLMRDLIESKILVCDEKNMLKTKVKIHGIEQTKLFVRFRVEIDNYRETRVWVDKEVYKDYIQYYLSSQSSNSLCYVSGRCIPCSEKHPSKIIVKENLAKLISANDDSGFTYRGRFSNKNQCVNVGYEISQKAHNALKWLIEKQGYKNGEQVIVAWGTENDKVPRLLDDTEDSVFGTEDMGTVISTEREFAERLNKAIAGYGCDLKHGSEIIIMALEAATPGRVSISYYKELYAQDFLERIKNWHSSCIWRHSYKKVSDGVDEKGKEKYKNIVFIGAPSPKDIAIAAYGSKLSDKLKKSTIERILPCIVDGARIPYDIVSDAINQTTNPTVMKKGEWEKALSISCALIKKYRYDRKGEEWEMALDEKQTDRSYLFGRLLAVAQQIEEYSLYTSGEKRDTNAERLMHQFKLHPYKTWGIVTDKLRPYIARLGGKADKLVELMSQINASITFEDFTSVKKLDDVFLLGYYCQRQVFIEERNQRIKEAAEKKLEKLSEGDR